MELKQLEFFVVCAQTRSFSRAADLLFTAQSNVSKVIKSLENELEMQLFERKQYGIALTAQGRRIYEYACNTLESARKISDCSGQDGLSELRICCNPSSWMASCFCDFYQRYAEESVNYSIMTAGTNEIIRRLAGEIDGLGFVYVMQDQLSSFQELIIRNHLSFTPLKRTSVMLYFGAGSYQFRENLEKGEPIDKIDLVQGYDDEFALKSLQKRDHRGKGSRNPYRVKVTTNSDYIMNELLESTSLGNISGEYLGKAADARQHGSYPLSTEEESVVFGCLFRNDKNLDAEQMKYLNFVKTRLSLAETTEIKEADTETVGNLT